MDMQLKAAIFFLGIRESEARAQYEGKKVFQNEGDDLILSQNKESFGRRRGLLK
jgi:hypothetical protein